MSKSVRPLERAGTNASLVPSFAGSAILAFDHHPRTRLVFGIDAVERLGEITRELHVKKVLLVTDSGIVAAGHAERVRKILEASSIATVIFDQVRENPTTNDVDACLQIARANQIDAIIGLGGGSSMDTAKGCNFLLTNGGRMQDYWGVGKAKQPMLPFIAIPTTTGTGSECQSAALIADEKTHQKMACLDPKAAACVAILDPILTLSQPPRVAACTGIDAISHAVETAVTTKRNAFSLIYSCEAFRLSARSFAQMFERPDDLAAHSDMQLSAAFAGIAIENSMLGAAHAAANPLTAHFGIVHGQAVGMMLPHIVIFNAHDAIAQQGYADLALAAKLCVDLDPNLAVEKLVAHLHACLAVAKMPASLRQCGVKESDIPMLAKEAAEQWTGKFNPREVSAADFEKLYSAAL